MCKLMVLSTLALSAAGITPAAAAPLASAGTPQMQYSATVRGDVISIKGILLQSNEPFDLRVRPDGVVDGWIGLAYVNYFVSRRERDAAMAAISPPVSAAVAPHGGD